MKNSAKTYLSTLRNINVWFVAACMTFALTACGSSSDDSTTADATGTADTQPTADTSAPSTEDTTAAPTPDTATEPTPDTTTPDTGTDGWNTPCVEDSECSGNTDYCAIQPTQDIGYCSKMCVGPADCPALGWGCNAVFDCSVLEYTWCGPYSEIENGMGIVIACE